MIPPAASVSIRTGARLHFGPLSYHPETGRHFGGIGMMIDRPGVHLELKSLPPHDTAKVSATTAAESSHRSTRAETMLAGFLSSHRLPAALSLKVFEEIPPHSGLGSGTQLALALQEGLRALSRLSCSPEELAREGGRGERSAIGLYGYLLGGFLVDAGHAPGAELGEMACRVDVPDSWRIILLHPQNQTGLHDIEEASAFQALSAMPESMTGQLCRLTLTELLPALRSGTFTRFTEALFEYGQRVGEFFAPTQGGAFSSQVLRELCRSLPGVERTGMAQSSWGPTVALFAENMENAHQLQRQIDLLVNGEDLHSEIVAPRNTGRSLIVSTGPHLPGL